MKTCLGAVLFLFVGVLHLCDFGALGRAAPAQRLSELCWFPGVVLNSVESQKMPKQTMEANAIYMDPTKKTGQENTRSVEQGVMRRRRPLEPSKLCRILVALSTTRPMDC